MFRLLRYYSIASAVAIVLATFAVTFIFQQNELKEIVSFTEKQNLALAQSFANQIEPRFSNFIAMASTDEQPRELEPHVSCSAIAPQQSGLNDRSI